MEDEVEKLKAAVARRQRAEAEEAAARAEVDQALLEYLRKHPDQDRDEVAQLADVSPTKVRQVAKEGGIPPRKRGGVKRRSVTS